MNRAGVVRRLLLLSTLVSWLSPSCGAASNLPSATPADAVGASAMATPTAVNSPPSPRGAAGADAAGGAPGPPPAAPPRRRGHDPNPLGCRDRGGRRDIGGPDSCCGDDPNTLVCRDRNRITDG